MATVDPSPPDENWFWDVGPLPKKNLGAEELRVHQISLFTNVFYPATAAFLLWYTKNPALALAVTWPGIFSSVYHGYAYSSTNREGVQALMFLDILSIVAGVSFGLALNHPAPSPGWITLGVIMLWEYGAMQIFTTNDHKWHPWWHVLSVLPVLSYAIFDIGETDHSDDIEDWALGFVVACFVIWLASCFQAIIDLSPINKNQYIGGGSNTLAKRHRNMCTKAKNLYF